MYIIIVVMGQKIVMLLEAVVKLYLSNGEMMQYSVPSGTGTVWNVFNIVNGEVKEINELAEIEN